jgi:hypothetical protein
MVDFFLKKMTLYFFRQEMCVEDYQNHIKGRNDI